MSPLIQVPQTIGVGLSLTSGAGSPEGIVAAGIGALYLQADGANGEVLWRKTSGVGATGWTSYGTFLGLLTGTAATFSGAVTAATIAGTLSTAAQPNITSTGALTVPSLAVSGAAIVTGIARS